MATDIGDNGEIEINTYPGVYSMYQPDSIVYTQIGHKGYLLTANEGDSRDGEDANLAECALAPRLPPMMVCTSSVEEIQSMQCHSRCLHARTLQVHALHLHCSRLGTRGRPQLTCIVHATRCSVPSPHELMRLAARSVTFSPALGLDADLLALYANGDQLGALDIHASLGLSADGTTYDKVVAHGGRSFSILSDKGSAVFDSGTEIEEKIAALIAEGKLPEAAFNADNDSAELDQRSDKKVRSALQAADPVLVTVLNCCMLPAPTLSFCVGPERVLAAPGRQHSSLAQKRKWTLTAA